MGITPAMHWKEVTQIHLRTLGWKCLLSRKSSGSAAANSGIRPSGNSGTACAHPPAHSSPVLVVDVVTWSRRASLETAVVEVLEVDVVPGGMSEPPGEVDGLVEVVVGTAELVSEVTVNVAAEVVVTSVVSVLVGRFCVVVETWTAVLVAEPGLVVV